MMIAIDVDRCQIFFVTRISENELFKAVFRNTEFLLFFHIQTTAYSPDLNPIEMVWNDLNEITIFSHLENVK